jgi:hypothetical protein
LNIFDQVIKGIGGIGKKSGELEQIQDESSQSPDEKKLVAHTKEKIDQSRQHPTRINIESQYLTNIAYLMGYDGVSYDVNYRQFKNVDPKRKLGRGRFKINKILPTVQNRLARLTQSPPKYDVRPNSNDSSDKDSARLGLKIIEDVFDKQQFIEKRQDLLMSCMQGGHAYIQTTFDPLLGKPMTDPMSEEFAGYEGEVRLEVLNCLEVFVDPQAKRIEEAQWVIKAKVRKLDYFKERYPDRGMAVKEEEAWLLSSLYDLKANALTNTSGGGSAQQNTSDQMKNSAIELVYYEKRSKDFPNGRKIISANGILLEDKELPIGEFDIVKFDDIIIGGRYNSEALITHLRPIQDQYNILRTKCADWIKKTLGGKYIAAKGAGLSQEAINNESGEVVEYNPVPNASEPKAMSIPTLPSYVYDDIQVLDGEFDLISGIGETSRGKLESASMPASLGALLQEQDQTRLSVQTNRNEISYAKVGCHILKYVGKYYQMPRLLKTAGSGLEYAVKEFVGGDLNDNYDVVVIPGSTVPNSKVLKRQDIVNAYQMGLLGNPQDPKLQQKVLKMMEFGDVAEVWKTQALDEAQVKKAIELIEQGEMPPYHEMDNHIMYIQELNDYRKGDKYSKLDDMSKQIFELFMETHVQGQVRLVNPSIPEQQQLAESMVESTEAQMQEEPIDPGAPQLPQPAEPPQQGPM